MKTGLLLLLVVIFKISCANIIENVHVDKDKVNNLGWDYPESLDALKAAPKSHILLMENDEVRVLRVVLEPGEREPVHTHKWKSVMYIEQNAMFKYYGENDELVFETSKEKPMPDVIWLEPEVPHSVENVDTVPFSAMRVEIKK